MDKVQSRGIIAKTDNDEYQNQVVAQAHWRIFNSAEGAADINVEGKKYGCNMFVP
jgi:hypothetical protein